MQDTGGWGKSPKSKYLFQNSQWSCTGRRVVWQTKQVRSRQRSENNLIGQKQGDQLETQGKTLAMLKGLKSKNNLESGIWTTGNECEIKLIKTDCQTNRCEW